MLDKIREIENRITNGGRIETDEALSLMELTGGTLYDLFPSANRLARHFKGYEVELCGIINAKSGRCAEDCAFCSQSSCHDTAAPVYELVPSSEMLKKSLEAAKICADRFGIVTSGTAVDSEEEIGSIAEAVRGMKESGAILPCASLGMLGAQELGRLKAAGLSRYHHNLEVARSYFPNICTTHAYDDDVETVRAAQRAGLEVCSGGIFGVGESRAQRVELAETLRELGVASVPINFLVPVPGTPLADAKPLPPLESLKIIAVYRFMLPRATIKVCAGRDRNLGDLASWIFYAGANAMMIGDYLTTAGRTPALDLKMIRDLGFRPVAGS